MPTPEPPHEHDQPALVLVGPMGAGKSAVGRRVAKALGMPFRDTDTVVVREHGPIAEIFVTQGEAAFRAYEHRAVLESLAQGGVIALGGGSLMHDGTREALTDHRVVLLTVADHVIAGRIRGQKRPLLNQHDRDPVDEWKRIRDERMPVYRSVADAEFDTSSGPMQSIVERIVAWVADLDGTQQDQTTQDQTAQTPVHETHDAQEGFR